MGADLSEPVMSKACRHDYCASTGVEVASCNVNGYRKQNEDEWSIDVHLGHPRYPRGLALVAVFDGHCGKLCSEYVSREFPKALQQLADPMDKKQLTQCFLATDDAFFNAHPKKYDGTTAIVALIETRVDRSYRVAIANLGDSRALLMRRGPPIPASGLKPYILHWQSADHKPDFEIERDRILAAHHFVMDKRVDGNLAVARSFGDLSFKNFNGDKAPKEIRSDVKGEPEKFAICAVPDITYHEISAEEAPQTMILLASDGLWDNHVDNFGRTDEILQTLTRLLPSDASEPQTCLGNAVRALVQWTVCPKDDLARMVWNRLHQEVPSSLDSDDEAKKDRKRSSPKPLPPREPVASADNCTCILLRFRSTPNIDYSDTFKQDRITIPCLFTALVQPDNKVDGQKGKKDKTEGKQEEDAEMTKLECTVCESYLVDEIREPDHVHYMTAFRQDARRHGWPDRAVDVLVGNKRLQIQMDKIRAQNDDLLRMNDNQRTQIRDMRKVISKLNTKPRPTDHDPRKSHNPDHDRMAKEQKTETLDGDGDTDMEYASTESDDMLSHSPPGGRNPPAASPPAMVDTSSAITSRSRPLVVTKKRKIDINPRSDSCDG